MAQEYIPERELVDRIIAYCGKHGISKSTFGRDVAGDTALVFQLEAGRELRTPLRQKIQGALVAVRPKVAADNGTAT